MVGTALSDSAIKRGVFLGSVYVFISGLGFTLTFAFLQSRRDELGCDALCFGSQTSLRASLSLIGNAVIGRLSDRFGRRPMLWVGLVGNVMSLSIGLMVPGLTGMWMAIVPRSLLDSGFSVAKALFADYYSGYGNGTKEFQELSGAIGKLGMAMGFSMMVGAGVGGRLLSSFDQAQLVAMFMLFLTLPVLLKLPQPACSSVGCSGGSGVADSIKALLKLPILRHPGALLLIRLRLFMGLAFYLFITIWTPSLKARFNFGPKDHGQFMSFVGLLYALAQGLFAKSVVRAVGSRIVWLMFVCMLFLSLGRVVAYFTTSLIVVYVSFMLAVIALGVVNTVIASAVSSLSHACGDGSDSQTGGLYGILEAVESGAGIVGPILGGILDRAGAAHGLPYLVLWSVICAYGIAALDILKSYELHIPLGNAASEGKEKMS